MQVWALIVGHCLQVRANWFPTFCLVSRELRNIAHCALCSLINCTNLLDKGNLLGLSVTTPGSDLVMVIQVEDAEQELYRWYSYLEWGWSTPIWREALPLWRLVLRLRCPPFSLHSLSLEAIEANLQRGIAITRARLVDHQTNRFLLLAKAEQGALFDRIGKRGPEFSVHLEKQL
jgi:hypothetical protein